VIFHILKKSKREKLKKRRFFVDFSTARGRSGIIPKSFLPRVSTNIPTKFDQNRPKDGGEIAGQTNKHTSGKSKNNTNLTIS
jgi:hypothetical protein